MPWYERRIIAGRTIEIERYFSLRQKGVNVYRRGRNSGETNARQKKINELHSRKRAIRLVNANFRPGDLFLSPTYQGQPPPVKEAKRRFAAYIRRLREWRRRNGYPEIKYFATPPEHKGHRIHHHVIVNDMPMDVAVHLWRYDLQGNQIIGNGRCQADRLDDSGDYTFIARYITKEEKPGCHRYTHSRNLEQPIITEKEISRGSTSIKKGIRWPKGYKLVEDRLDATEEGREWYYARAVRWESSA